MAEEPFSKRHKYRGPAPEITIREDAPESLRVMVLETSRELEFGPSALRDVLCRILRVRPDSGNWSEYPNIWYEVQNLAYGCEWFRFYDFIEGLYAAMIHRDLARGHGTDGGFAAKFAAHLNSFFEDEGIGWQLLNGKIVTRGAEAFEVVVAEAETALKDSGRPTAAGHVHDALHALSRRPTADAAGAIYHSMGALECVARDLTSDPKATLGEILKHHPALVPAPLDKTLSQVWGYASNVARHVVEGHDASREDAELVVGLAATVTTYLTKRASA